MAVSRLSNPQPVLIPAAGILPWGQPQIRGKLLGVSETFEISDFHKGRKRSLGLNAKKTGHMADLFLIDWSCRKFFYPFIKAFQLICQLVISREIF